MANTELGKAYVQIVPSAEGISGAISGVLNSEASAAGDSAGKKLSGRLKKVIAAAGIGTALGASLKKSLSEGADMQQAIGGIKTLFGTNEMSLKEYAKSAGKSINSVRSEYKGLQDAENTALKNANKAYKTAGLSANDYMETITSFAAALKSSGLSEKEAAEAGDKAVIAMADNANKMGTNMEDIQNAYQGFAKQNYTMLDNLKLGYGGTKGEMERLLADAEKLSGKKYDISNLSDVYSAIQVIQDNLGITGTTAKEGASTFSGSLAQMKAAADNFMGSLMLGENVGESMTALADSASNFLFNNFLPAVGRFFTSLPTAISAFIESGIPAIMENGEKLGDAITKGLGNIGKTIPEKMNQLIPTLMNNLVNLSDKLRGGVGKLVDVGLAIIKAIATGLINNLPVFIQTIPTIISNIAGIINDNAPKIIETGAVIIGKLAIGIVKAIPVLIENIPAILKAIFDAFMAFGWSSLGKSVVKGIGKGLKSAGGSLKSAMTKPISSLKELFSDGFGGIKSNALKMFSSIKTGIKSRIDSARATVKKVIDKIKSFFPLKLGKILSFSLPKINISSIVKKIGGKSASAPDFNVRFQNYAKGAILDGPTLIGLRAGEAGREGVIPLEGRYMRPFAKTIAQEMPNGGGNTFNITLNANGAEDPEQFAQRFTRELRRQVRMGAVSV